jgi:hypothetical protein
MAGEDALYPPRMRVGDPGRRGVAASCQASHARAGEKHQDLVALADAVVQQLLAVGLATRSLLNRIVDPELAALAEPVVDGLDATISEIRTTVLSLQTRATRQRRD